MTGQQKSTEGLAILLQKRAELDRMLAERLKKSILQEAIEGRLGHLHHHRRRRVGRRDPLGVLNRKERGKRTDIGVNDDTDITLSWALPDKKTK